MGHPRVCPGHRESVVETLLGANGMRGKRRVGVRARVPPLPLWVIHGDLTVLSSRREVVTAAALWSV